MRVRCPDLFTYLPSETHVLSRLTESPRSHEVGCVVSVGKKVLLHKTSTLNSHLPGGHRCPSELGQPWSRDDFAAA